MTNYSNLSREFSIGTMAVAIFAFAAGSALAADLINTSGSVSGSYDNAQVGYRVGSITDTVGSGNSLSIGSGSSNYLLVGVGYNGVNGAGTLDASAADSFTVNVGNLYVGINAFNNPVGAGTAGGGSSGTGILKLGTNNTITAATKFLIGGGDVEVNTGMAAGNVGTVTTAANGTTTIYTPYMALGTSKGNTGQFTLGSGATLNLGTTSSRTQLIIGRKDTANNNENRTVAGTMDLSGGIANLTLSALRLSYNLAGLTGSYLNGTMTLNSNAANHLDIKGTGNVVQIGYASGGSASFSGGSMTDTLTIGNLDSTSVIESTDNSTAILIGQKPAGAAATVTGTLNLNGGTLTIKTTGSAIAGGNGTSHLNIGGNVTLIAGASSTTWIQNLTSATNNASLTIDTQNNNITVPQAFSGTGSLTKAGAGVLTLTGNNGYTGTTTVNEGTLRIDGAGKTGTGTTTVAAGAAIGGTGIVAGNLTLQSGAKFLFSTNETLTVSGTVSFDSFGVDDLLGLDSSVSDGTYTLISGAVNTANLANLGAGNVYNLGGGKGAYFQVGSLDLVVAAIPEPSTLVLVGFGLLSAVLVSRRSRKTC